MPELVRNCILTPIPIGKKDPTISDDYCPFALSSDLSKALEWSILLMYFDSFMTTGVQFSSVWKMSTSLYTGTVIPISWGALEGPPVFAFFLDASKAFDLVNDEVLCDRLSTGISLLFLFVCSCFGIRTSTYLWSGVSLFLDSLDVWNGVQQWAMY